MTPSRSEASVAVLADGTIEVRSSLVDMGQGLRTVLARAAGRSLGIDERRIAVIDPDTAVTPFDATTSSSRGTWAGTMAVEAAARDLRQQLLAAGAGLLEAPMDTIELEHGRLVRQGSGAMLELPDVVAQVGHPIVGHGVAVNEAAVGPDGVAASSSHWHQGAVAVRASVDTATGEVRVAEAVGAAWAGRVVDRDRARLQDEGSIVFGLGPALFEELRFPAGSPSTTSLLDYRIPSVLDVPSRLVTHELEAEGPDAEPTGLGESLIPAVAPAVAAAVQAATGARIDTLPLAPERVLGALDAIAGRTWPTATPARPSVPTTQGPAAGPARRAVDDAPVPIALTVDGEPVVVHVPPLTPLQAVLADALGIRSVRSPCGVGACGACTVLEDGRAIRACLRPIGLVAGREVVTSSGLDPDDRVVRAFIDAGAAQCGSCIPGMVLAARAALARRPSSRREDARDALAGNLCRCGTYERILDAVVAASDSPLRRPSAAARDGGRSRS